jgi:hypothetical protein
MRPPDMILGWVAVSGAHETQTGRDAGRREKGAPMDHDVLTAIEIDRPRWPTTCRTPVPA